MKYHGKSCREAPKPWWSTYICLISSYYGKSHGIGKQVNHHLPSCFHPWHVYLHLVDLYGKWWYIYQSHFIPHGKTLTSNLPTAASLRSAESFVFCSRSRRIKRHVANDDSAGFYAFLGPNEVVGEWKWMVLWASWMLRKKHVGSNLGWKFTLDLPNSLRKVYPVSLQIATFWYPQNRLPHHHFCYPC